MKYVKQFLIILAVSLAGEILKYVLPLPIPASIYGMAILFTALMTGLIKLDACGFTDFNEQCIKERCPFYE